MLSHACMLSCFSCGPALCNPVNHSMPGTSVHGISLQEYWSVLQCPSSGNFPNPGIEPMFSVSPALQENLLLSHQGRPCYPIGILYYFHFFFFLFDFLSTVFLEKAMAPHSSTLAWKIPWTEEPGRLQSMGSLRVGHD